MQWEDFKNNVLPKISVMEASTKNALVKVYYQTIYDFVLNMGNNKSNPQGMTYVFGSIVCCTCLADGNITPGEYQLMRNLLGFDSTTTDIKLAMFAATHKDQSMVNQIAGIMKRNSEAQGIFMQFIALMCAIDGPFSSGELAYMQKLFNV